jgi:hypothetical protein
LNRRWRRAAPFGDVGKSMLVSFAIVTYLSLASLTATIRMRGGRPFRHKFDSGGLIWAKGLCSVPGTSARQMEILKRSIEQLAAPICDSCNVEMAWSRSALVAAEKAILHVFICPGCNEIGETKTPMKASKE